MRGILEIEHKRGKKVISKSVVENMASDVFNKMIYDLFYAVDSTVYSTSSMLYYDTRGRVLTLPRMSMYLSEGVESDSSAAHPPSIIAMTSGLSGSSVCGNNYLVSVGASGKEGGLSITAEFNEVEGSIRSVGLCIPSDNNYNCNRSNSLYTKELGLVLNHDDYIKYHSLSGYYSNLLEHNNSVIFAHVNVESKFGDNYNYGTYIYEVTDEGLNVIKSYSTFGIASAVQIAGVNRCALVPCAGGYTLLVCCEYKDGEGVDRQEVLKIDIDKDLNLTGKVVRTGVDKRYFFNNNKECISQVVKTSNLSVEGMGSATFTMYESRGKLYVCAGAEGYINSIDGATLPSLTCYTREVKTELSDEQLFRLMNGTYRADGMYIALGGTEVDLSKVYDSGELPTLSGDGDYLVNRCRYKDYSVGIVHHRNPFADKDCVMLKESVNVSIDKPKIIMGRGRSLLTNALTDGVVNIKRGDTLRVTYNILV